MISINEFMGMAKDEILAMLPGDLTKDLVIEENRVVKMNDQVNYGLTMRKGNDEAAPTIYMNDKFDRYMKGDPLKALMAESVQEYLDSLVSRPEAITADFAFETIRDDLTIRIVEVERNREFLKDIPYLMMGNGFAAICDLKVQKDNTGYWKTTITRGLMQENNYDKQEMFKTAIENSQLRDPVKMSTMEMQLFFDGEENLLDMDGKIPEMMKSNMYILTNEENLLGSAVLFYPGVQEKIAEKLGEGYFALPSSVHEFIIVPESSGIKPKDIADMVYEANHSGVVDPKDILSDNVFHFDKNTRKLETIKSEVAREVRDDNLRS